VSNSYDLTQYGGRMLHAPSAPGFYACEEAGVGEVWWFGWGGEDTVAAVDPHAPDYADRLTAELMDGAAAQRAGDGHQRFAIRGSYAPGGKAYLWEASKLANGGAHFRAFRQITGSCVGQGLGQAVWYLSAWEVARLNDPEQVSLPFWLLAYGKSRQYAGMRGRGEGSWGTTAARAAREDGFVGAAESGLPQPSDDGGLTWGRDAELQWSDGAAVPAAWLEKSRKHLIKTTAQCKSAEDVAAAVQNGYPCTIASNWGGQMRPSVQGDRLLNKRATTWNHQMCVAGWEDHASHGELYYILNSWGVDTHGTCPSGAPPGGFWIRKADMQNIVGQEETFALSQFDGFPSQDFFWNA
jgi:hypothetical protein